MHEFKVGDKIKLTGEGWPGDYHVDIGTIVEITKIRDNLIFAGNVGSVGTTVRGLYEDEYASELVETLTNGDTETTQTFAMNVNRITNKLAEILIQKSLSYGDSALNPVRIFSKADRMEQLYTRLDDKLSRVQKGHEYPGDDTIQDIMGYCALLLIARESN